MKYTGNYLEKLEDVVRESDYVLRYEKGNFKAGYCILKDIRVVIINKYFSLEGKINALADILKTLEIREEQLSEKSKKIIQNLKQSVIHF